MLIWANYIEEIDTVAMGERARVLGVAGGVVGVSRGGRQRGARKRRG